jgi:hypothetical protein
MKVVCISVQRQFNSPSTILIAKSGTTFSVILLFPVKAPPGLGLVFQFHESLSQLLI